MSYKISVGSRAKGYATPDSDDDYILFKVSSKKQYLEYFTQVKLLQNCVRNKGTADEYTESDLLFGLRGIYLGNYPHLFVFGNTTNVPNEEILKFIKQVGILRLKPILKNLVSFAFNSNVKKNLHARTPKHQLQKLFNLSYVDYCLQNNECPPIDYDILLPALLPKEFKNLYYALMSRRMNNDEECLSEEINLIDDYHKELNEKVLQMDEPDEYTELLQKMIDVCMA